VKVAVLDSGFERTAREVAIANTDRFAAIPIVKCVILKLAMVYHVKIAPLTQ
jgi:hypothetical protein